MGDHELFHCVSCNSYGFEYCQYCDRLCMEIGEENTFLSKVASYGHQTGKCKNVRLKQRDPCEICDYMAGFWDGRSMEATERVEEWTSQVTSNSSQLNQDTTASFSAHGYGATGRYWPDASAGAVAQNHAGVLAPVSAYPELFTLQESGSWQHVDSLQLTFLHQTGTPSMDGSVGLPDYYTTATCHLTLGEAVLALEWSWL